MEEIWIDIAGFEGVFQISNLGRIKSLFRLTKNGQGFRPVKERIRKSNYSDKLGYSQITLKNIALNNSKRFYVHLLVAKHFIPNPENKPEVNHKDGNKLNSKMDNLEWATVSENQKHAYDTGLKFGYWKDKIPKNNINILCVKETAIMEFPSKSHCAKHFNVSIDSITYRMNKNIELKGNLIFSI